MHFLYTTCVHGQAYILGARGFLANHKLTIDTVCISHMRSRVCVRWNGYQHQVSHVRMQGALHSNHVFRKGAPSSPATCSRRVGSHIIHQHY
jgi:hypothetical protein